MRLAGRLSERARESAERLAGLAPTRLGVMLLAEKLLTYAQATLSHQPNGR
jgi:hypothetical protein